MVLGVYTIDIRGKVVIVEQLIDCFFNLLMYVVTESIEFFSLLLILFFLRGAVLSFFLDLSICLHFGNALLFKISAGSTVHEISF